MKKINIGAGLRPKEGYINLDIAPLDGINIIADARDMHTISDGEYDVVHSYGFIEHISRDDIPQVLSEMKRILKSGGKIEVGTEDFGFQVQLYLEEGISGWTRSSIFGPHYSHRELIDEALLKQYLKDAGFRNIQKINISRGILYMEAFK